MTKSPSPFAQQVYRLTSQVPAGRVTTYKQIGQALGTKAYRAIGQVLRCNPYAPAVPCHRVVSSDGSLGGFRGSRTKTALADKIGLLEVEGVRIADQSVVDFYEVLFSFPDEINSA
jgi:methylated-DNA-[protein]-cysteine S-methyltransferase